jgi:pseudouridine-5'-phosphate glycosidase
LRLPKYYSLSPEIIQARTNGVPVVALETTVLTHGLPNPENIELALGMEREIRSLGAIPAAIGILNGKIHVGMDEEKLRVLVAEENLRKISRRDFAPAIVNNESGGTTVAGTLIAAHKVGIRVFATGGIGGVHRDAPFDVSADLPELSRIPLVVVCAGAKAILDLPATLEYLETAGVPVLGYKTDEFPAFYSVQSGYPVSARVDSVVEIAEIAQVHWALGLESAILVVAPPPQEVALPLEDITTVIEQALSEAKQEQVRGQEVTPFLLSRVSDLTGKASLIANLGLLRKNAQIAARIAVAMATGQSRLTA